MPKFLTADWILSRFDQDRDRVMRAYRMFLRKRKKLDVWKNLRERMFLGTDALIEKLKPMLAEKPLEPQIRIRESFAARPGLAYVAL